MKKIIKVTCFFLNLFFLYSSFFIGNLLSHAGVRSSLYSEIVSTTQQRSTQAFSANTQINMIGSELEFLSLLCKSANRSIVVMVGDEKVVKKKQLDQLCFKQNIDFYLIPFEQSGWMNSWLTKTLSYSAQSYPLFLFFQGKTMLLPLCHGEFDQRGFVDILQKKFNPKAQTPGLMVERSVDMKSTLFPKVDFVLTATNKVFYAK